MIIQFLGNGLVNGSLIALTALGFALIYNTMRVFHIAYAGIYLWAGYVLYVFLELLHWPLIPSVLAAIIAGSLLSVLCELLLYKPLRDRGRSSDSLMISSVGLLIVLVSCTELFFGNAALFLHISTAGKFLGVEGFLPGFRMPGLMTALIFLGMFLFYLKYTRVGIRIRALRDNETLSRIYGVRAGRLKIALFALSGAFAAIASVLSAMDVGINPQIGLPVFINAFVALVIGGVGRFEGPVIGGLLLGLLQALTEYFFDSRWVMMVTFILLIFFLLLRPQGLIPEKSRAF
ncbi:MAG: branched-chain amino acid ABC transporter permease [Bacteroidetes bacterium]|nr:branched-chain amino acid ABC transporter permease [Bacteroidota bacterium]